MRGGEEIVNYETGKWGVSYRPELIDAEGNRCWCSQLYTPGKLHLDFSDCEEWLQSAVFPVILDPTFGYTSIGGTANDTNGQMCTVGPGLRYVSADNSQIISFHVYARYKTGTSNRVYMGAYEYSGGEPTNRLSAGVILPVLGVSAAWKSVTLGTPQTLVNGTEYVSASAVSTSLWRYRDDIGGTQRSHNGNTTSTLPDPWGETVTASTVYTYYATYEVTAVGNPWYHNHQQQIAS
jgi:hypothetical protein